jgi:predicted SprT family Zn-dependent metalloprotease
VWIEKYHLTDWIVTIEYSDTECKDCDVEWTILANTTPNHVYHKSLIIFYPAILKWRDNKGRWEFVRNCIKHEVAHILTSKIAELAFDRYSTEKQIIDEIESLTQRISIIT